MLFAPAGLIVSFDDGQKVADPVPAPPGYQQHTTTEKARLAVSAGHAVIVHVKANTNVDNLTELAARRGTPVTKVSRSDLLTGKVIPMPSGVRATHITTPIDVISDVHGDLHALERLLTKLGYDPVTLESSTNRLPVFVGDLVGKGPDQIEVLQRVFAAHRTGRALMVLANHEWELSGHARIALRSAGLDCDAATMSAALQAKAHLVRKPARSETIMRLADAAMSGKQILDLVTWIRSLPTHLVFDRELLTVVHATMSREFWGKNPEDLDSRRSEAVAQRVWAIYGPNIHGTDDWAEDYVGHKTHIVQGHFDTPVVTTNGPVTSIDTGAHGYLSALRWPERELVQSTSLVTAAAL